MRLRVNCFTVLMGFGVSSPDGNPAGSPHMASSSSSCRCMRHAEKAGSSNEKCTDTTIWKPL